MEQTDPCESTKERTHHTDVRRKHPQSLFSHLHVLKVNFNQFLKILQFAIDPFIMYSSAILQ